MSAGTPPPGGRILVTGGTGYLGEKVARVLSAAGYRPLLLARPGSRRWEGDVEWVEGDLLAPGPWAPRLEEVEAVVHTAGLVKNWDPDPGVFDRLNVQALDELLHRCQRAGVGRVVITSSFFVLGPSTGGAPQDEGARAPAGGGFNDYDRTKILAVDVAARHRAAGLDVIELLPGVIYGPGARTEGNHVATLLEQLLGGKVPGLLGSGEQQWNYAFVDDVAEGHRLALERGAPGGRYVLGGENVSMREFIDLACELGGRAPLRRKIPLGLLMVVARLQMLRARLLRVPPEWTPGIVRCYGHSWALDDRRARADLGYAPRGLREGLGETLRWLGLAKEGSCPSG